MATIVKQSFLGMLFKAIEGTGNMHTPEIKFGIKDLKYNYTKLGMLDEDFFGLYSLMVHFFKNKQVREANEVMSILTFCIKQSIPAVKDYSVILINADWEIFGCKNPRRVVGSFCASNTSLIGRTIIQI